MTDRLSLPPRYRRMVEELVREHVPDAEVWAYGSRVNGESHEGSDLDLVVRGPALEPLGVEFIDLVEALQESNIPILVQIHDWAGLPGSFHREIERDYMVLQEGTAVEATNDWREVTLGECAEFNGSTYSPHEEWPFINYLDTGNISDNCVAQIQRLEFGKDKIPSRARRKVAAGDIVYSTVRPNQRHFGLLKSIPENFLASTGFAVLRGKEGFADTGFLYWFLTQDHIVDYLHSIAENSTSAYPSIRPGDLEQLTLSLPPLPEQRAIAHVLGTLDDKIELNRRMNETLEAMARALFKAWFVDFEPVRAKMEGRWRRGESLPCLPTEHYDLFPDRLVDSELGEMPEGWEVGVLNDVVEILSGGTPKTSIQEYWDGDIPWYTAKDAPALSDIFVLATERSITQTGVDNSSTKILPDKTTVISARGTVGRLACLGIPMAMNQTCYGIRGTEGYPDFFTYWNVRNTVSDLRARTHGTIFDTITRETFKIAETVLVPVRVAQAFEALIVPSMNRTLSNLNESITLAAQRDALLGLLVSGDMRVDGIFGEGAV